jgi:tetratricopeptide (TPR) repeat protein
MSFYTSKQVREILGLSPAMVSRLVEAGFVTPARGPRRELRFSFQDLVVLRAAKGLADARLPARRISASLKKLRQQLPGQLPAKGLRIAAVGNTVAVLDGRDRWRAADGQYLLAFDVSADAGEVVVLDRTPPVKPASQWFDEGCRLEERDASAAIAHYRAALAAGIRHPGLYLNLGRLLHEAGETRAAGEIYLEAIRHCPDDALLHFNQGVLLDDLGHRKEAIASYEKSLEKDPKLADAYYNLALLYEAAGRARDAVRCFSAYRKLEAGR